MKGLITNIEKEVIANNKFRRVMYTSKNLQLVKMNIPPGESVGEEKHPVDQFIRIEEGVGTITIDDNDHDLHAGVAVVVPGGVEHNITNTSTREPLKFYTVYGPPKHKDGLVQNTKDDDDEDYDDETTEDLSSKKEKLKKIIKK